MALVGEGGVRAGTERGEVWWDGMGLGEGDGRAAHGHCTRYIKLHPLWDSNPQSSDSKFDALSIKPGGLVTCDEWTESHDLSW